MAGEGSMAENEDVEEIALDKGPGDSYTLEILRVLKDSQQRHGLRHADYQRYRQYCARRIRRVRKSLHFPQGNRSKVQPKKVTEEILAKDWRYLYIPLIEAERSWAYGMQLKSEANTEPRKRFHMINRLKKAVQHTEGLALLCETDKCDARTKLEAQAYNAWMKGSLDFELERWKSAMEHFNSAKTIYEKLASALVDDNKELYIQRVEEISPNLRYCAYNIGDESAIEDLRQMRLKTSTADHLTLRLDELIEKTREKQVSQLSEVTWRGRKIPVKNEQVRIFLLSLQDRETQIAEADTEDSKLSLYETLLKELIDAQQSMREELKDDPTFKSILKGQQQQETILPSTVYLHSYLAYIKQTKTVQRNLVMAASFKEQLAGVKVEEGKKITKPQDLARLYDIIIQNLLEIPNLPGLQEDGDLSQEINIQVRNYKAHRCFYTAQSYAAAKKWKEAVALFEKVIEYSNDAIRCYKGSKQNHKKEISALEELINEVDGQKYSCQASSILDVEDVVEPMAAMTLKNNKPLCDRLDEYAEDPKIAGKKPNLTQFPPDFQPVACKPWFFDLALSKVEFPSLDDKLEQRKQGGGITGLVKGWLWGGGNK